MTIITEYCRYQENSSLARVFIYEALDLVSQFYIQEGKNGNL